MSYNRAMTIPGEKEWFYCQACDTTYLFRGDEQEGHKEPDAEVRCEKCTRVLGHLRCDVYPAALLRQWSGKHIGRMEHE